MYRFHKSEGRWGPSTVLSVGVHLVLLLSLPLPQPGGTRPERPPRLEVVRIALPHPSADPRSDRATAPTPTPPSTVQEAATSPLGSTPADRQRTAPPRTLASMALVGGGDVASNPAEARVDALGALGSLSAEDPQVIDASAPDEPPTSDAPQVPSAMVDEAASVEGATADPMVDEAASVEGATADPMVDDASPEAEEPEAEEPEAEEPEAEEPEAEEPDEPESEEWISVVDVGDEPEALDLPEDVSSISGSDAVADAAARPEITWADRGSRMLGVDSVSRGTPSPVVASPRERPEAAAGGATVSEHRAEDLLLAAVGDPLGIMREVDDVAVGTGGGSEGADPDTPQDDARQLGGVGAAPSEGRTAGYAAPIPERQVQRQQATEGWSPLAHRFVGAAPTPSRVAALRGVTAAPVPLTAAIRRGRDATGVDPSQDGQGTPDLQPDADRDELASGQRRPQELTEPHATARTPTAAFDEASDVDRVRVVARGSPLGAWTLEVDALIRERWNADPPLETDQVFGLTGDVVIVFRVTRGGKVEDVEVTEESGVASFDALARLAIPPRVPPPPDGPMRHRIRFQYR